ncbi:MAG: IS1595 family transposase [bacterium]|nr:IS1595 family transposase [bacterium]
MAKINKYGVRDFERDFPNEEACIRAVFNALHSEKCSCGGTYRPLFKTNAKGELKGRRQYQCSKCRFQIAPTSGTIFHKSDTPLRLWFLAIFLFSNAKSGYSAKQLERDLNVTYKTGWRILNRIRKSLKQSANKLGGVVEMDETYFGGRYRSGQNNKGQKEAIKAKSVIVGAITRGGDLKAKVAPNIQAKTLREFIEQNIDPRQTILMTDDSNRYLSIAKSVERYSVNHSKGEYVRNKVFHINNVESFWSHIKRSVKGTHKVVSKKYLQNYVDGFVFHYNNRHNDSERFSSLLGALLTASR